MWQNREEHDVFSTRQTVVGTLRGPHAEPAPGYGEEVTGPALCWPPVPVSQGRKSQQGASHGLHAYDRIWALEGTQESQKGFVPNERRESPFSGQGPPKESAWARQHPKPGQRGRLDLPCSSPGLFKPCKGSGSVGLPSGNTEARLSLAMPGAR